MIAQALSAYGVRHVVTSPGSRNAPLLMALARCGNFELIPVIDERSAAFEALGIADVSGRPVAICCTSGSAMLNYAPALSEAYYRGIPLIAVTADRPEVWIDQADSQTIRQPGALANIVKASVSLNGDETTEEGLWFVNRRLNDVLTSATTGRRRPVHINVHLSAPLTVEKEYEDGDTQFHKIEYIGKPDQISVEVARDLALKLIGRKVLVVGGFNPPDDRLGKSLAAISRLEGFEVIDEGLANLKGGRINYSDKPIEECPEILITFGGSFVSAKLKTFLRDCASIKEHWHIGEEDHAIDTFRKLTKRIDFSAEGFFPRLAGALGHHLRVGDLKKKKAQTDTALIEEPCDWGSRLAVKQLFDKVPEQWNIQLGNGMSVRYASEVLKGRFHRVSSNRGVSGIDGCVSTAIGASIPYDKPTLLLVGDMSAQYDLGALASNQLSPKLKIVVLDNGGGEIFRRVATTRDLAERERLIAGGVNLPLESLAATFGLRYLEAKNQETLSNAVKLLVEEKDRPCILRIIIEKPITQI